MGGGGGGGLAPGWMHDKPTTVLFELLAHGVISTDAATSCQSGTNLESKSYPILHFC